MNEYLMNQDFFSIKVLYFIKKERVSERGITKDLENINYVLTHSQIFSVSPQISND